MRCPKCQARTGKADVSAPSAVGHWTSCALHVDSRMSPARSFVEAAGSRLASPQHVRPPRFHVSRSLHP